MEYPFKLLSWSNTMNRDCNENLPWIHVCGHFNTIQSILICGMNNVAVQQPSLKLLILNSFTGFSNHTLLLLRISMWWYPIFDNRIQLGWMGWKVYADFQRKLPNLMKNNWKTSTTIIVCKWNVNCIVCDCCSDLHQLCLCVPECSSFIWRQGGSQAAQSQGYNTDLSRA